VRNIQFRPKNVCQKCLSTLKNSTLSRPPDNLADKHNLFIFIFIYILIKNNNFKGITLK